jgi:hypothetical protein
VSFAKAFDDIADHRRLTGVSSSNWKAGGGPAGRILRLPRGVYHNPNRGGTVVLIETVTTNHTGDVETPLTRTIERQLS